jgi:hypothetical protein
MSFLMGRRMGLRIVTTYNHQNSVMGLDSGVKGSNGRHQFPRLGIKTYIVLIAGFLAELALHVCRIS